MHTVKHLSHTYLRYDGDLCSQIVQTIVSNVVVINEDGSTCCLNDTEHGQSERGLASTSTTNYTNLRESRKYYIIIIAVVIVKVSKCGSIPWFLQECPQ